MLNHLKKLRSLAQRFVVCLSVGLVGLIVATAHPASADPLITPAQYIGADGRDLTAMAECLPKKLSEPNLARALQESKNDFLEKVFDIKPDYDDYKLDATEAEYLSCMESKGVMPQVKR